MKTERLSRLLPIAALATAASFPLSSLGDDAAGLMRVGVAEDSVIEMPFAPFGDATPTNFISGPFFGGTNDASATPTTSSATRQP